MERSFKTIETHTLGEPTRIILEGFPSYNAKSMMEYKEYLMENYDHYRNLLMCEPRGHKDMVGALLVKPISKHADVGVIYMDANRWINMCGHATIGVAMVLVKERMVEIKEPLTHLTLETPAGLIQVEVKIEKDKIQSISFENIPSFLYQDNCTLDDLNFSISYSGSFFALVDVTQFNKEISLENVSYYKTLGVDLLKKMNGQYRVKHPSLPIQEIANIEFYKKTPNGQRNIVISEEGQIDRSTCGTCTCAKLAYMYATNQLKQNEKFVNESFTGVSFTGEIIRDTKIDEYLAIVPKITGMAYIDGYSTFIIDEKDPLKYGFNINE